MGDSTDELLDLAEQVIPAAAARELDMLLTAGERISMALVAMAIADLGHTARSFTGSQAGVITDSVHGKAKIIDVTPGRIEAALEDGAIAIVAGFQGVSQDTKDITTLGRGGIRHHRGRAGRRSRVPRSARSTPTSTASSRPTRASCPPPASSTASPTRRCSRWPRRGAKILHLRCVEYARRYDMPIHVRSSFSQKRGHLDRRRQQHERSPPWKQRSSPESPTTGARPRSRWSVCPDKVGVAARIFEALADGRDQPRHDRPEHLGGRDRPHRHLVHAAPRRRPDRDVGAGAAPGRGRLRAAALRRPDRQGLPDRCRHALAPGITAKFFSALARPGSTSR